MSGSPDETEVQDQWKKVVDILESTRNYADGTVAGASGKLDNLLQIIEGEYTPDLVNFAGRYRAGLSDLLTPGRVREALDPILFEYARLINFGSGFRDARRIARALYEHFHNNSLTVTSRNITYDTGATTGPSGTNAGNGAMSRLTVDENNYNLEACHVETKRFRCRRDQNSGTKEEAEEFEVLGQAPSFDSLLRGTDLDTTPLFGSGIASNRTIVSRHAGTGAGGSLLRNSSFTTFDSGGTTEKFSGWTLSTGTQGNQTQDTTNFFRGSPGTASGSDASMKLTGDGGATFLVKQTLTQMNISALDVETPYFFRVLLNKSVGSASGGTVTIRLGSASASETIANLPSGWAELAIAIGTNCWPRNFNDDPFDVEIEWASHSSGFLLVDDVIFAPWDLIDGTYWILRGGGNETLDATAALPTHAPWLVDDELIFSDTGGLPADAKVQWWNWSSGLRFPNNMPFYLPSAGSGTFDDP